MSVSLHAPPPLTRQVGLPPFSAQRANLAHITNTVIHTNNNSAVRNDQNTPTVSSFSAATAAAPTPPLSSPVHVTSSLRSPLPKDQKSSPNSKRRINPQVWAELEDDEPIMLSARTASTFSSAASGASSSSTVSDLSIGVRDNPPQKTDRAEVGDKSHLSRRHVSMAEDFKTTHGSSAPLGASATSLNNNAVIAVPPPVLVEQQTQRIRELVHERDGLADELKKLRDLFQRLSDDYEQSTHEAEARQLQLDCVQTQHSVAQEELQQVRLLCEQRDRRIRQFEEEWGERSKHLRAQLDALMQERDAMQSQRDVCMSENSDLRRQLIQLQGELYEADVKHREALRELASTHAQELRSALQEKEEQLQARSAATRHEARLTQQQICELGASQTAVQEDCETLRWRLGELETVVDRKEHLRQELERLVAALRAQIADHERQSRNDTQRYGQRAQELEQTYQAQVYQEQRRCQTLQDELAAARRALQEAHRQYETLVETHATHTRELTARNAKQEDELREQLRSTRVELTESQGAAARHEAAAHRNQRELDALQASVAAQQEEQTRLQEALAAQRRQFLRTEGQVEVLKVRLQEKEKEAELLRCTMEQTTWTAEMRGAMQHTLAAVMGVPRAVAMSWLQKRMTGAAMPEAPQLEWQAATPQTPPASPSKREINNIQNSSADASSPFSPSTTMKVKEVVSEKNVMPSTSPQGASSGVAQTSSSFSSCKLTAGEADAFRSPVRSTSASTQAAATTAQHVETIERTVIRPASSPISVVCASPSNGYVPPPLHPGTATTTTTTSTRDTLPVGATGHAVHGQLRSSPTTTAAAAATAAADGSANLSASSAFPLRTLSFTSARAGGFVKAATRATPSKSRHPYDVAGDESEEDARQRDGEAGRGEDDDAEDCAQRQLRRRGNDDEERMEHEEVYFDDINTPNVRRGMTQQRMLSVAMTRAGTGVTQDVIGSSAKRREAPEQPSCPASSAFISSTPLSRTLPKQRDNYRNNTHNVQTAASAGSGDALAATTPSTPGVRAAEVLTRLPTYAPITSRVIPTAAAAAPPSITSIPLSSVSVAAAAAAARQRHGDPMSEDEHGLQHYLRETVQQVLASQRGDPHSSHLSKSTALPLASTLTGGVETGKPSGVRGHSHFTQLYDGSPPRSMLGGMTGDEGEVAPVAVEADFGFASQPLTVLSALPWQQQQRSAAIAQPNYNLVPAGILTADADSERHRQRAGRQVLNRRQVSSAAGSLNVATSPSAHVIRTPNKGLSDEQPVRMHERARWRVETGVADTLEQLARRQQRLLRSLGNSGEGAFPYTTSTFSSTTNAGFAFSASDTQLKRSAHAQLITGPEKAEKLPNKGMQNVSASEAPMHASDATNSEAFLDPRQLSYATAATTNITDSSTQANEQHTSNNGIVSIPWQEPITTSNWPKEAASNPIALDRQQKGSQPQYRVSLSAFASTAATPPSASSLSAPAGLDSSVPSTSGSLRDNAVHVAAPPDPVRHLSVSFSSDHWGRNSMPPSAERVSTASNAQWPAGNVVTDPLLSATANSHCGGEGRESTYVRRSAVEAAAAPTGTRTASVLTSVSEESSLTQLEQRFAQPFER